MRERDGFRPFLDAVIGGDVADVRRRLAADPALATGTYALGATRLEPRAFFFPVIRHYLYANDTALHMAAAAFQRGIAEILIAHGADVHARNRMGAMPLHYAADTNHWNPGAQAETIAFLISAGADPNDTDRRSVTPLHRAVRTRSSAAVRALLTGGADPRKKNGNGSTPLQLAKWTTGRGGSGSAQGRTEQAEIIRLLRDSGATR
jgi:ankyrin repeat protein